MMEKYQVNDSGARAPVTRAAVRERRSPNRPFAGKPAVPRAPAARVQPAEVPIARPKTVANGNDADWREF
jgi:hypothetical protein